MSELTLKRPSSCPRLRSCRKKVDELSYTSTCANRTWIWCPLMKEEAKKYLPRALPCEWKMIKKLEGEQDGEK